MTGVVHRSGSAFELQTEALSVRLASEGGNDLVLEATRQMLGILFGRA
jgi:hypothetical protein